MLSRSVYWLACLWACAIVPCSAQAMEGVGKATTTFSFTPQAQNSMHEGGLCLEGLAEDKCSYRALDDENPKRVYKFVINAMLNNGWARWNKTSDIPTSKRVLHVCCGREVLHLTAPKIGVSEASKAPMPYQATSKKSFDVDSERKGANESAYETFQKTIKKSHQDFGKAVGKKELLK